MDAVRTKLEALGYEPADWQLSVTEEFVAEFERSYGLRLPAEYRNFLLAQRALALARGEHETARALQASILDLEHSFAH